MADLGDQQQRFKVLRETELEILSIEKELKRIGSDRLLDQAEFLKNNNRLRTDLQKSLDAQKQNADERKNIEQQMRLAVEKYNTATSTTARDAAEVHFETYRRLLELSELDAKINKSKFDSLQEEVALEEKKFNLLESQKDSVISFLGKFGEVFSIQKKYNDGLQKMGLASGAFTRTMAGLLTFFELIFETFKKMDEGLAKFRISMGMMRTDMKRLTRDIVSVAAEFASVGVDVESAANAAAALASEFGGTMKISKDLIGTTAILKSQLGVAEESSAGFLRNISALGQSTAQAQLHMVHFAGALSAAAGVPLNMVMQDVSKMSGNALAMISKMPLAIVKSAVAARQMGTTINKMADASANLLNFTESVQAEMEASVLVGEAINLQQARQLAYQGKIVESTKAILKEANRINFERLDFFQMNAFAAASGRSVEELLKMTQAQKQLAAARLDNGLKDEVALYDKYMEMAEADLHNVALQREMAVKTMANQARMAALQQQWNQLLIQSTAVLFPVIDAVLKIGILITKLAPAIMPFVAVLKFVGYLLGKITIYGLTIGQNFAMIGTFISNAASLGSGFAKVLVWIGEGAAKIGGIFKFFSKFSFLAGFAKAIPVIGWIITGLTFVYSLVKRLMAGEGIGKALKGAIYDTLLKPFVDAWTWIKSVFVGNSPSKLALGIVKGIVSVGTMIYDALTWPFRHFLAWVADKIPGMGGIAKKLRGGLGGALETSGVLEKKASTPETKPLSLATEAVATSTTKVESTSAPEEQKRKEADSTTLSNILTAITQLNANLAAGKIGVYIDGQLMSATLSRQTAFKGGYGMNMA